MSVTSIPNEALSPATEVSETETIADRVLPTSDRPRIVVSRQLRAARRATRMAG